MQAISDDSFYQLIKVMENHCVLSFQFKVSMRPMLYEVSYEPGRRILNFGQTQQMIWFMLFGLAREIKVDKFSFRENTSWFWMRYDFLFTTPGFFSQEASEQTIEVLERSRMILISLENWKKLKVMFPEAELFTEKIRAAYERLRHGHLDEYHTLRTEPRYLEHHKTIAYLLTKTKLRYVAEFMGMAPDTLGRLRKKYANLR